MLLTKYAPAGLTLALALVLLGCGGGSTSLARNTNPFVPNGKSLNGKTVNMTATITAAQAIAAALAAQPGTAGAPELGDENGVAVYDVPVTAVDSKKYDVKVDANTGKVFTLEADSSTETTSGSTTSEPDGATGPNHQQGPDTQH